MHLFACFKLLTKSRFVSKDVGLAFNTSSVTKAQAFHQPQHSLGSKNISQHSWAFKTGKQMPPTA